MFDANEQYTEMVDSLFRIAENLDRGDILGHDVISEVLGVEPHVGHWGKCVIRLKKRMELERSISLWSEHTVGYKLCTEEEQIGLARERQKRARRHVRKGIRSLAVLPQEGLSMRQRESREIQLANLKKSHAELTSQIYCQLPTRRPTPTLPRVRPT